MTTITRRRFGQVTITGLAAATLPVSMARAQGKPVKIGVLSLTSHAPSIIAGAKGYFADAGLAPEFVSFQAAQPMAVAIASGDVDFGVTAISGGLISLAERGAVRVIGGALQETPGVVGQKILVSKAAYEAGVTTPKALQGKRFGITTAGSSFHYMAHKIADGAGFPRDSLQLITLNAVPAVIAALRSGQIDAWSIVPNIAAGLVKSGDVMEIGDVADFIDNYQVTTVFTSTRIATEDPDTARAFITGFSRGVTDYNAALVDKTMPEAGVAEITAMIHKFVYTDRPFDKADPAIRAGAMRVNPGAALNMASVADQLDWFKSESLVPASAMLETLIAPGFVKTL